MTNKATDNNSNPEGSGVQKVSDPYSELGYVTYPYPLSHPDNLQTIAKLFGLKDTNMQGASLLEIGCGSGGNLIAIASRFPTVQCKGIDISEGMIKEASSQIKDLGLQNVSVEVSSIKHLSEAKTKDKYDYIVVHNVLSWLSQEDKNLLFKALDKLLKSSGVVFISYNLRYGSNAATTMQDILAFNTSHLGTFQEKLERAFAFLTLLQDIIKDAQDPYFTSLSSEASRLLEPENYNQLCEYLIGKPKLYSFSELVAESANYGLQYLGDSFLPSMFIGNAPEPVAKALEEVQDIISLEEYLDFFYQKRFKGSLFCRQNLELQQNLAREAVESLAIFSTMSSNSLAADTAKFDDGGSAQFVSNLTGSAITTSAGLTKAILHTIAFGAQINPITPDEIVGAVARYFPNSDSNQLKSDVLDLVINLALSGHISFGLPGKIAAAEISQRPKISSLALWQTINQDGSWVTNLKGQIVPIEMFDKYAFRYMDGLNDFNSILEKVLTHFEQGDLRLDKDDKQVTDREVLIDELSKHLNDTLQFAQRMLLLVE